MTVGELRELLGSLPDDAKVMVRNHNPHSGAIYLHADVEAASVVYMEDVGYVSDRGGDLNERARREPALLVG